MRQTSSAARTGPARPALSRGPDGVFDLGALLAAAESSRVLNLTNIHLRWGRFEEHAARPLFENRILNRAIIMKCAPRPGELFEYNEQRIKSTKILFPLDRNDLSLGSFSGIVGQKDFSRIMSRHLDGSDHLSDRDEKVLGLIDQLPTLDPFLLYALLKSNGVEVCQVYFQLTETDRAAIQTEMAHAFTPLVLLCFPSGDHGSRAAATFIDKILNFEESAEIDSLRAAFKLDAEPFSAALFAWRGLIYYKWKTQRLDEDLNAALPKMSALKLTGPGSLGGRAEGSRAKIVKMAAAAAARVKEINARYDAAFADFVGERQADRFRQFLINAPSLFMICGQSTAIVEHIINFIDSRPAPGPRGGQETDLADLFAELERELGVDFRVKLRPW
ncbi:MAG TPA: hypothetical protein VHY32_08905 [Caulobacteraceae bacterium]|jgi:hypothetical protein|nr:hypothetical protein [Caulobacteraceae bacterium]